MALAAQKAYKGMGMEGPIARWYEKTARKDLQEIRDLAARLRSLLPAGGDVLEVAPGPGFLSVELARDRAVRVTGLDISHTFVEIATRNATEAGVPAQFRHGNASQMPFDDNSFDLLVCRAAFKNFSQPERAIEEMRRVLRPRGQGLIIDLRRDTPIQEIERYFERLKLGSVRRWLTVQTFRWMLLKRAYSKRQIEKMLDTAGFAGAGVRINDIGLEAWFQK